MGLHRILFDIFSTVKELFEENEGNGGFRDFGLVQFFLVFKLYSWYADIGISKSRIWVSTEIMYFFHLQAILKINITVKCIAEMWIFYNIKIRATYMTLIKKDAEFERPKILKVLGGIWNILCTNLNKTLIYLPERIFFSKE